LQALQGEATIIKCRGEVRPDCQRLI
jgi:hypothetical protein